MLDEIAIRVERVIQQNFGDNELGLAEKIHLCSLLEDEFDINIDYDYNDWEKKEDIYNSVRKILEDNDEKRL